VRATWMALEMLVLGYSRSVGDKATGNWAAGPVATRLKGRPAENWRVDCAALKASQSGLL
jgi:hypothetical protein